MADLVFDNQFKDLARARMILETALEHGWEIVVRYVHRHFKGIPRAVIERSQRTGRWNHVFDLPGMHLRARVTVGDLLSEFRPRGVFFQGYVNSGFSTTAMKAMHPIELKALAREAKERYDGLSHEWKTICKNELEKSIAQGAICKELAAVVSGGT